MPWQLVYSPESVSSTVCMVNTNSTTPSGSRSVTSLQAGRIASITCSRCWLSSCSSPCPHLIVKQAYNQVSLGKGDWCYLPKDALEAKFGPRPTGEGVCHHYNRVRGKERWQPDHCRPQHAGGPRGGGEANSSTFELEIEACFMRILYLLGEAKLKVKSFSIS